MKSVWMLLGAALVLVSCGSSTVAKVAGGSVGNTEWTLEGVSPDGEHLLVSTLFGGVASDCTRFEGWDVAESDGTVEITARLWRRRAPSGCTDEGVVELLQVDLDQPLGDRELKGCGDEDCHAMGVESGHLFLGQVVAASNAVAVAGDAGLSAYTADGELVAKFPGFSSGRVLAVGDDAVIRNDRDGTAIAVDLLTGEEIWRTTGWVSAVAERVVYVCRGQDSNGLTAVDTATGEDRWTTNLACDPMVSHGDLLTVLGYDPDVDGGHRLVIVDEATGDLVSDEPILDGYDDQVTGFEGAIAVGSNTIVTGVQANLVVLTDDGVELDRQRRGLGHPMGGAEGVAILGAHDRLVGYDVVEQSALWTLDVDAFSTVAVDGGSVWTLDRTGGTVSRLDPTSGEALWTAPVGLTSSFDVSGDGDTAYVITTQAVIAVDNDSGEIRWATHTPYDRAD